ncbi:hypothetical protein Tco_1437938 [Tanacetum coccineum]
MGLISASSASVSFPDLLLSSCTVESVLMLSVSTKSASNVYRSILSLAVDLSFIHPSFIYCLYECSFSCDFLTLPRLLE